MGFGALEADEAGPRVMFTNYEDLRTSAPEEVQQGTRLGAWEPGSLGLRPQDGLLYADWAPGLLLTWGSSVLSLTLH